MYILIHAYMYATESKVLGLDQIGGFQTTESSLYTVIYEGGVPVESLTEYRYEY